MQKLFVMYKFFLWSMWCVDSELGGFRTIPLDSENGSTCILTGREPSWVRDSIRI